MEDSEDDALLIVRELQRGGYEPDWKRVETPEAMREALAGSDWDVIISDHRMPRFGPRAPGALQAVGLGGVVRRRVRHDHRRDGDRGDEGLRETAQRRRVERELRRRDAILDAVRFAAERLLGEAVGWEESIRAVLGRLGRPPGVKLRLRLRELHGR